MKKPWIRKKKDARGRTKTVVVPGTYTCPTCNGNPFQTKEGWCFACSCTGKIRITPAYARKLQDRLLWT